MLEPPIFKSFLSLCIRRFVSLPRHKRIQHRPASRDLRRTASASPPSCSSPRNDTAGSPPARSEPRIDPQLAPGMFQAGPLVPGTEWLAPVEGRRRRRKGRVGPAGSAGRSVGSASAGSIASSRAASPRAPRTFGSCSVGTVAPGSFY